MMLAPTLTRRSSAAPRPLALLSLLLVLFIATLSTLPRSLAPTVTTPAAPAVPRDRPALPAISDLPQALQYQLSATVGGDDPAYQIAAVAGGSYRAASPAQHLEATLGAAGMSVQAGDSTWRVGLAAWGRAGAMRPAGAVVATQATANRLALRHPGLRAWYRNGPLGLQQGWSVDARPAGAGPLALALRSGGALRPELAEDGRAITLHDAAGRSVLRYAGLLAYDASGRELPARFVISAGAIGILVDDRDAAYPLTVDPWAQSGKLTASDGAANAKLGGTVAMSADGATVVAGAYGRDGSKGAAYVFTRPTNGWASATQAAILTASDGASGDWLGAGVALSADGTTVVAGAYQRAGATGAAYVFVRPAGGWADRTQTAILTASDGASGDNLGWSVAVSADGATVVAGAPRQDDLQSAASIFVRPGSGWADSTQAAILTASDAPIRGLGHWVALSADGATVVAGAPARDDSQGAAYVFVRPGGGWAATTQAAILTAAEGASGDHLGWMVALSADGATVVAGAPMRATAQGAAYVFVRPGGGWADTTQAAILTASDGAHDDRFGVSVAVSADGATIIAGAQGRGAAYVFVRPGGGWADAPQHVRLTASDGNTPDQFGHWVAVSADGATVAAGAYGWAGAQGAAYVFAPPVVSVGTVGRPSRAGASSASFVITSNAPILGEDLTVPFTLGGTAIFGVDYNLSGTQISNSSVVIPAGASSMALTVTPVSGALPVGLSIELTLNAGAGYLLGTPASASMTILPSVAISAAGSPSRNGPTPGTFTVTRTGALNQSLRVTFDISGTAVFGTAADYTISGGFIDGDLGGVTIPIGQASASFSILPTTTAAAGRTIIFSLANDDPVYVAGAPPSAGLTIDGASPPEWLVLLYLAGDDVDPDSGMRSLTPELERLLDTLPANPSARIVVLFDGNGKKNDAGQGDSRLYLRAPGGLEDVTAGATDATGWRFGFPADRELDTGSVSTLQNFIRWARTTYPGSPHTMLAIVDHGGGWAPDLSDVPQPPPGHVQSGGTRGLSIDQHSQHSLSTRNSGEALQGLAGLGHFDVLFLDACLMGMIESTYELRSYADYIIAGENLLWSAFPYHRYLAPANLTAATTPRELAEQIVRDYNEPAPTTEPFSIAAIDSSKLGAVTAAVDDLGAALIAALDATPALAQTVRAAYSATQKFDYDANLIIGPKDGYVDLLDLSTQLQQRSLAPVAAQAVADAVRATIVRSKTVSGTTAGGREWDLSGAHGLAIYLPLGERDCRPTGRPRIDERDIQALDPCADTVAVAVGAPIIEPQLAYYSRPGQLAFTSAGGAPSWAALLSRLDPGTANRTQGAFGSIIPAESAARPRRVYLPLIRR